MQTETNVARTRGRLPIHRIMAAVSGLLGAPNKRDQYRDSVEARHMAMYLCHEEGWSLTQIGRFLGRHHTTVLAGYRKIKARCDEPETAALLAEIRQIAESPQALPAVPRAIERKPQAWRLHPDDLQALAGLIVERLQKGAA